MAGRFGSELAPDTSNATASLEDHAQDLSLWRLEGQPIDHHQDSSTWMTPWDICRRGTTDLQ
mgnify:CR=1 FL=1